MNTSTKVLIQSADLSLRDVASSFFDSIRALKSEKVIIDFTRVKTITASFASQYIKEKKSVSFEVVEINVATNISKMLEVASKDPKSKSLINFEAITPKILTL